MYDFVKSKKHFFALIFFALVALCFFKVAQLPLSQQLNEDQIIIATMVLKDSDPELFSKDLRFGDERYEYYLPFYRTLIKKLFEMTGDIFLAHSILLPFFVFIYLAGMYFLLYKLTGNCWVSIMVALLSLTLRRSLGGEYWGIPGIFAVQPRNLFLIICPFLFYFFYSSRRSKQIYFAFFLTGLAGNLHPIAALHFVQIMLLAFLFYWSVSFRSLGKLALCAAFALIGILPFLLGEYITFTKPLQTGISIPYSVVSEIVRWRSSHTHFPIPAKYIIMVSIDIIAVSAVAFFGLYPRVKERWREDDTFLIMYILACLIISLGVQAFVDLQEHLHFVKHIWKTSKVSMVFKSQLRGFKFIYLALYIFCAYAFVRIKTLNYNYVKKLFIVGFAFLWLAIPLGTIVYKMRNIITNVNGPTIVKKEGNYIKHIIKTNNVNEEKRKLFLEVCQWTKDNTPMSALIMVDPWYASEFRFRSQRSIVVSYKDISPMRGRGKYVMYNYFLLYKEIENTFEEKKPNEMMHLVNKLHVDYVVVEEPFPPLQFKEVFANGLYKIYDVKQPS